MDSSKLSHTTDSRQVTLLVVDDDRVARNLLAEVFEKEGYHVLLAGSAEQAIKVASTHAIAVIISDIRMLGMTGLELLGEIKKNAPQTIVILMTAFGSIETAVEAIHSGAFEYLSKPFKMQELKRLVVRAIDHWRGLNNEPSVPMESKRFDPTAKTLIGHSSKIVEVYRILARAATSHSSVLIQGESGTGKELVARAIHQNSARKSKPFVAVNCGSLSEGLLESELFGHVKGAFSGAVLDKRGLFEEADGGTLFLDEIGDVTPALQVKLLRVLQEGEFRPVGGRESRLVDVRLITATHRDLNQMVSEGTFRKDLYYRLRVICIYLPPLRERLEDLEDLVSYFLRRSTQKNSKNISHVSEAALTLLQNYNWPGNIRELENAIETAVAMANSNVLYPEDFPREIRDLVQKSIHSPLQEIPKSTGHSLDEMEKWHITSVLQSVNFNKSKAAKLLGIDRATLYRKAKTYSIALDPLILDS